MIEYLQQSLRPFLDIKFGDQPQIYKNLGSNHKPFKTHKYNKTVSTEWLRNTFIGGFWNIPGTVNCYYIATLHVLAAVWAVIMFIGINWS